MEHEERRAASGGSVFHSALIISEVRFLCDSLIDILKRIPGIRSCDRAETLADALTSIAAAHPAIILLDVAFPSGTRAAAELRRVCADARVIALGVKETDDDVLAWAEAGIAGYVPNTSSVQDMVSIIEQILRGEQSCTARIAGTLLRHIANSGRQPMQTFDQSKSLTRREMQVLDLVNSGFSNKDIARCLHISLGTTKTHVHHVLAKLNVTRRANAIARMHNRVISDPADIHPRSILGSMAAQINIGAE
jgi:DNA-binding NarL/FixJ family response regulator